MSLLIFTIIVVVLLALAIAAIEQLTLFQPRWQNILKALAIFVAIVAIAVRAGVVSL